MSRVHPHALMSFSGLATSRSRAVGMNGFAVAALPTDPIGNFSLTLENVVIGSAIQVESTAGQVLLNQTADASTEVLGLQAYSAGSSLNSLRIKVRKGSASPYYQPWETLATAIVGSQAIYVSQIPDE